MKSIALFLLLLILIRTTYPQEFTKERAQLFLKALIAESPELISFVDNKELKLSDRLSISYPDAKFKFLISNDPESSIKERIRNKELKYTFEIEQINNEYSLLKFHLPSINLSNEYYFFKAHLVSKPAYLGKDWTIIKSRFFQFHLSSPDLTNSYAVDKLDSFVENILSLLMISDEYINRLQREKIHYYLCRDESEIEKLTGYKARGLYYLPYDYIISTYNSHYHELLHLLLNYKLKSINQYTLPFLQEGFAVGFGGRGGIAPEVALGIGQFLSKSGFIDHKSMLDKSTFGQIDPSITYPVSGLYTKFLISAVGIEKYIHIYRKYSTDVNNINQIKIDTLELPGEAEWKKFLISENSYHQIRISGLADQDFPTPVIDNENIRIYKNDDEYLFK